MRVLTRLLRLVSVTLVVLACAMALGASGSATSPLHLTAAASSPDELVARWLAALASKDEAGLHRLRVTRGEYLAILVPWTVKPGDPPRQVSQQVQEFFWALLDTRSRDWGRAMMAQHGGERYRPRKLAFSEAPRQYAGYTAHGLVRLEAVGDDGLPRTVNGPWIAEVDGKYKFIGLDWTD
jgi:hypothetical protein